MCEHPPSGGFGAASADRHATYPAAGRPGRSRRLGLEISGRSTSGITGPARVSAASGNRWRSQREGLGGERGVCLCAWSRLRRTTPPAGRPRAPAGPRRPSHPSSPRGRRPRPEQRGNACFNVCFGPYRENQRHVAGAVHPGRAGRGWRSRPDFLADSSCAVRVVRRRGGPVTACGPAGRARAAAPPGAGADAAPRTEPRCGRGPVGGRGSASRRLTQMPMPAGARRDRAPGVLVSGSAWVRRLGAVVRWVAGRWVGGAGDLMPRASMANGSESERHGHGSWSWPTCGGLRSGPYR